MALRVCHAPLSTSLSLSLSHSHTHAHTHAHMTNTGATNGEQGISETRKHYQIKVNIHKKSTRNVITFTSPELL